MRTYQTLSLIGCIIGIFLSLGLGMIISSQMSARNIPFNNTLPTESERQEKGEDQYQGSVFWFGTINAFFIYIIILVITFVVRTKTKAVGITIIILGIIGMAITQLWGIIPFAILLPAGLSALRHKQVKEATS